eukprot:Hpha_TRINITY_DN16022_c4_g2::TRINITY_DN16022_c4_g2_i1::g.118671::m.118671
MGGRRGGMGGGAPRKTAMKMDTTPRRAGRGGGRWRETESEWEYDEELVASRTKQVQFTQRQPPYQRLLAIFRKDPDQAEFFPVSPDPRRKAPHRVWEKELRTWREELEKFVAVDTTAHEQPQRGLPPASSPPPPRRYSHQELLRLRSLAAPWTPSPSAPWADTEKRSAGWTTLWSKTEEEKEAEVPRTPLPATSPAPKVSPEAKVSIVETAEDLFPAGEAEWIREEERTPPVTPAQAKAGGVLRGDLGDITNTASPESSVGPVVSSPPVRRVVVVRDRSAVLAQIKRMQAEQAAILARQQLLQQQILANTRRSSWTPPAPPASSWAPPVERHYAPPAERSFAPPVERSIVYSPQTTDSGAQYFEYGGTHYFAE